MKILHACLRYPPATGGVETYVRDIVERTRNIDLGRDVRVLTSRLKTHTPLSELLPDKLLDDPPYVQRLFAVPTPRLAYPRLKALDYYLGHHHPNIIQAYSYWYQPADAAARYARRHTIPLIFFPMFYLNDIRRKPVWRLYDAAIGRRTFKQADIVGVISPFEQSLIEKEGYPVKRFELLPPGVDFARLSQPKPDIFAVKGWRGHVILSVGRLARDKGYDEAINALAPLFSRHPDLHYVIVGEDFGAKSGLYEQIENLGLSNKIHLAGRFSDEELISAYQHASVFLHPSHYEAFGIVLAESAASGTPVVARRTAAIPYVIPDNKAGLLFDNPGDLVRSVERLLNDRVLYKRLSLMGREHIQRNFNWDTTINRLYALYDELVPTPL